MTDERLHSGIDDHRLSAALLRQITTHASTTNSEVCGFIYKDQYIPILNIASRHDRYLGDPKTVVKVLSQYGEPEIIFHSHPNGNLELSAADRRLWYYVNSTMMVGCVSGGHLRWKIYGDRKD